MVNSMTGFAARRGAAEGTSWVWDLRSVNGKGLELRFRLPELDGLEPALRTALAARMARGNVTLSLKLARDTAETVTRLNPGALAGILSALKTAEAAAETAGLVLAPSSAADILAMRGVMEASGTEEDAPGLLAALMADLPGLLDDFTAARAAEGARLAGILAGQIDRIATLTGEARILAEARRDQWADSLRQNLARVLDNSGGADPARVAQELALIAVKADVAEELDRLTAHVAAARALLAETGPVGRKLDFLVQEFNREANTLCSKAQGEALTRLGLDLKHVIDQMREQIQNVE